MFSIATIPLSMLALIAYRNHILTDFPPDGPDSLDNFSKFDNVDDDNDNDNKNGSKTAALNKLNNKDEKK